MIVIGSDHTGIDLKKMIIKYLVSKDIDILDVTDYKDQTGKENHPNCKFPMFSIRIPKKKTIKIAANSNIDLYLAFKVNISSIIPIANIKIAPIKYPQN